MERKSRAVVYDRTLRLEAYRLQGFVWPFPAHFHTYYVVGLVEAEERQMVCNNRTDTLQAGSIVLLNPGDSHACVQQSGTFDYRGFNIPAEVMQSLVNEITGRPHFQGFSQNVMHACAFTPDLRQLHEAVMTGAYDFAKEEKMLILLSELLQHDGMCLPRPLPACRKSVALAYDFLKRHFAEKISLDQLCRCANLSRSTLLRAFTSEKGVTPYRCLESIRIDAAKMLLEQGKAPADVALSTGFSDQSHFTNCFTRLIGLPPGAYRESFCGKKAE